MKYTPPSRDDWRVADKLYRARYKSSLYGIQQIGGSLRFIIGSFVSDDDAKLYCSMVDFDCRLFRLAPSAGFSLFADINPAYVCDIKQNRRVKNER